MQITSKMNLFVKVIDDCKGSHKCETTLITFIFVNTIQHLRIMKNSIDHSRKGGGGGGGHHHLLLFYIPSPYLVLVHSVNKTHLLVVPVEFIWLLFLNILSFNFVQTPNKSLRFRRFRSYVNHFIVVPNTVKIVLISMFYVRCV